MTTELYIGLMSGTSIDSIDAVLLEVTKEHFQLLNHYCHDIPNDLKLRLDELTTCNSYSIDRIGETHQELGYLFAQAAMSLLEKSGKKSTEISAIGSHGQTIRHRPPGTSPFPFSWQIGDASVISLLTGITTVADFRSKDIAAGGQGAPLAPIFHRAFFSSPNKSRAIINIGGISNLSKLDPNNELIGFDLGPGNRLMDAWCEMHQGKPFDENGNWAKSGIVSESLLEKLLAHPFLSQPHPKSTGREEFNLDWLNAILEDFDEQTVFLPQDVQATLLEFTATCIAEQTLELFSPDEVFICGGGAFNTALMTRLSELFNVGVKSTADLGIDPQQVESAGFAWLAMRTMKNLTNNCPSVTGATRDLVLGAIYPAAPRSPS